MSYSIEAYYRHEHDEDPVIISSAEEVDQLVDALLAETFDHTMAALYLRERPSTDQGYPDHDFRIGVDADRKVGSLRFAGSDGTTKGAWYVGDQPVQHDEVFYEYAGHPEDFPLDSEVALDVVRGAVKEFLQSGGLRPTSVEWKTWPSSPSS
jgi:hypothetical protein